MQTNCLEVEQTSKNLFDSQFEKKILNSFFCISSNKRKFALTSDPTTSNTFGFLSLPRSTITSRVTRCDRQNQPQFGNKAINNKK
jgi:hypothetical protein